MEGKNKIVNQGKIRAVVFGCGFGMFPPLLRKFKEEYEIVAVIEPKIPIIYRYIFLIISFHPSRKKWRRRWLYWLEKTPFIFKKTTQINDKIMKKFDGMYDMVLFLGAESAPVLKKSKPLFVFTDSTRVLSSNNVYDYTSHFKSDKERIKWLELDSSVYNSANKIFVGSNFVKNSLLNDYNIPMDRVVVSGFGAGIGHADRYDKTFDGKSILFIGKGDFESKGGFVLLDAFSEVRKIIPDAVLHIVGQEYVPKREGVINQGFLTDRTLLRDLMKSSNVFVLPSLVDRFGIVLLEAMAAYTPCITTNYGAMPEVVGNAGIIVPCNDRRALAEAIIQILKTPTLAKEYGTNGRNRFEKYYNWDAVWSIISKEINMEMSKISRN